ncbi:hypothetical protein [uncultured Dokdonia sp.]|uniref:hypothetical protein n=1 Tax=uncultured Dokdonia sp. TaxID=575653 RepID=UPI002601BA10|nr:hypothetical protein [uncultured Dokdonia sp.]
MIKKYLILLCLVVYISCNDDEKAVDIVFSDAQVGAVLRTQSIDNLTFDTSQPELPIQFTLEYQDGQETALLSDVDFFISFIDNTPDNGDNSSTSEFFRNITTTDFTTGVNGLPVTTVTITTQELLEALNVEGSQISCTDQFVIDLTLNLTDGRSFSNANTNGPIIGFGSALNSPFTYDVIVVDGIDDDLFTGTYSYTSIEDGFNGPTIISPDLLELTRTRPNARSFEIFRDAQQTTTGGVLVRSEVEFTIACDQIILTRYVRSSIVCGAGVEGDVHVLLGPATNLSGTADPNDDTVFDIRFIEAFEGFDGFCGWPTTSSAVRLSKQ